MQQEVIFNVFEGLFPVLYTNLVQFMEPKMDVSYFLYRKGDKLLEIYINMNII